MQDRVSGSIVTITYHNVDTGAFIAKVQPDGQLPGMPVTVTGRSPAVYVGELIDARGSWVVDPRWGRQLKSVAVQLRPPTQPEGILRYLESGAIKGIGKSLAKRLFDHFGASVFDVLETTPERLSEVPGIGKKRIAELSTRAQDNKGERAVLSFLLANGLAPGAARKIYATYGEHAIDKLRENPYRLSSEVFRIGFLTSDKVALNMGIPLTSPYRLRAGIVHLLQEATSAGACGLPAGELLTRGSEILRVERTAVREALLLAIEAGAVVKDAIEGNACIFLPRLYRAEHYIAGTLTERTNVPPRISSEAADSAIAIAEAECGLPLKDAQREAVALALRSAISVITGGPGRGKTACIKVLVTALLAKGHRIALAAPTGKAAKRLAEATGQPAKTLHLTLGASSKGWVHNPENPLDVDVVIVDEFSMVDVPLAATLFAAIKPSTQIVLVGDKDQLPSVGPGRVFADMVLAGVLPVGALVEPVRQAADSLIITAADCINRGEGLPDIEGPDYQFLTRKDISAIAKTIVDEVLNVRTRGMDPLRDVQVLSPMRKSEAGTIALNEALRSRLCPPGEQDDLRITDSKSFRIGDKVIQSKNARELGVMNGDIGFVTNISISEGTLVVEFDGVGPVVYSKENAKLLDLAYCITIHKSQGSEAPVIVVPISSSHFIMMQRNLIYTAMTRAKKRLILVGQQWVAKKAAENAVVESRHSMLLKLLRAPQHIRSYSSR